MRIPDEYTFDRNVNVEEWRAHLSKAVMRNSGITNFPESEVLNQLTHPAGMLPVFMRGDPDWVWSDDKDLSRIASEYYQAPISALDENDLSLGHNPMVDELYWRRGNAGRSIAPGVPGTLPDLNALLMNVGANQVAAQLTGQSTFLTGKGTAAGTTSVTTNLTLVTNAWAGAVVYVADTTNNQIVYGIVISNTNAAGASVVTVDQWYNAATPGGAAATTPAAGFEFILTWALPPAWFMGITTTNITPAVTDTSLTGEATTNGMSRKIAAATITASTAVTTGPPNTSSAVSATYTYTGSGATTFYALGLFLSNVKTDTTDTMYWETLFSGSFTVTNNGDQATVTDTISIS
jgi:hypothetical protein